jgi:hypothetical protein
MVAIPPLLQRPAMLYKFKSKDSADVIMMGPAGDVLLRLLGREPSAKGIFEPADLPAAMAAIEKAVADDEAAQAQAQADAKAEGHTLAPREGVNLRQRAWPLLEMMRRAQAKQHEVVWGV